MLSRDVSEVLERHGYPRVRGKARAELEDMLWRFLYAPRIDDVPALLALGSQHFKGGGGES